MKYSSPIRYYNHRVPFVTEAFRVYHLSVVRCIALLLVYLAGMVRTGDTECAPFLPEDQSRLCELRRLSLGLPPFESVPSQSMPLTATMNRVFIFRHLRPDTAPTDPPHQSRSLIQPRHIQFQEGVENDPIRLPTQMGQ